MTSNSTKSKGTTEAFIAPTIKAVPRGDIPWSRANGTEPAGPRSTVSANKPANVDRKPATNIITELLTFETLAKFLKYKCRWTFIVVGVKMAFEPFDEFFRRMRRMFRDFDREFAEIDLREFERRPGISGFKIEIRDHGAGKPEVKVTRLGKPPTGMAPIIEIPAAPERRPPRAEVKPPEAKPSKPIKCMLETNVGRVEKLDEVILTMQAADVKKEDVEVRRLGNTLELIARKRTGEAYFGAFELPPDAIPGECTIEVKDGMVMVIIPRRRRYGIRA